MKIHFLLLALSVCLISCKQSNPEKNSELALLETSQDNYKSFGEEISPANALNAAQMKAEYASLKPGDSIKAKFRTTVNSVCKMKGCWMTLELPEEDNDPMVKFRDYAFFVPKDIEGREVIVEGVAFMEETSVEDQKHYAEDAGRSKEEIAAITEVKRSPAFLAIGVLLKE
ncbi:hypothetical protein GCM10023115_26030 [Pontixanthobacter gangjinensis]|uniref:DUF4920 domain-containing protein n=1 Tax=Christiangramia aestuarii TaxID=1028746 RepID=A0A7K1LLY8_9FLAO|nr:DUF4920 domain-containing protein [Christiangramia aestuarii]MUP41839.1 DUF4920 domain-containing protein [Christiangramia aestuarii]